MKIFNYTLLFIVFSLLFACSEKEQVLEESEMKQSYNFQKEINVYDKSKENYIVVKVESDYSDSLDVYVANTEFLLYMEDDLKSLNEEFNQIESANENSTSDYTERAPSVFISVLDDKSIKKYALGISEINLKSTNPWWPVPFEAVEDNGSNFLGVKSFGANDLGVRFATKNCWLCGWDDVSMLNIRILYAGEKWYLEDIGNEYTKMRASFYQRNNEVRPTKILAFDKSTYNQL